MPSKYIPPATAGGVEVAVIINGAIAELADINKDPVNDTELLDELNVKLLDPAKTAGRAESSEIKAFP